MHLKRQKTPKNWPITRKGTTFVVRPNFGLNNGIPILIALRDVLKIAKNKKEVKKAIFEKKITLNDAPVISEKNSMMLFDKLGIIPLKKFYKLNLTDKGKFDLEEVSEDLSKKKIAKIIGKKTLKKKKIQINLSDGRNYLSTSQAKVGDSVVCNFKEKKILKVLPLKEKANVIIVAGKHSGKRGTIEKINGERKMVEVNCGKDKINALIKQIMVVEK